ncbi:nitrate reductase accessory protein [Campylobacter iguaniorum]|uniref:hypothetical protein n=1 Tax=Campylobacter iguaniorum TaxID=1244531 RepID=UPI0007C9292B|nr:hypothetical protein [Campylobacter iguaniorum]ANE36169.1 nitrate reductase accessory protein [Campylobacter iguaniorum]
MKFFVVLMGLFVCLFADYKLDIPANAVSAKLYKNQLFIGTDNSQLLSYDLINKNLNKVLKVPNISTTIEENIGSRISAIDIRDGKIAIIYETDNRQRRIGIFENNKLSYLDVEEGLKELFFIDDNTLLVVGLSSELYYLDLKTFKLSFQTKLTYSSWIGDSEYLADRNVLVAVSEGGVVIYYDLKTKKIIKELPIQKDILYSVGAIGDKFVAGSAENLAYYFDGKKAHIFESKDKHVLRVGLGDKFGAYYNEDGIDIFTLDGKKFKHIDYDKEQIYYMLFWNDELITVAYDNAIYFWSIK